MDGNVRMLLRFMAPVEKGNAMVADGSMGALIESLMKQLKAEAGYFSTESRCASVLDRATVTGYLDAYPYPSGAWQSEPA